MGDNSIATVPFFVYEEEIDRAEKDKDRAEKDKKRYLTIIKWLVVVTIVAIICTIGSNIAWLVYESQYDKISYSQDGDGNNNLNTGQQGDVNYESDTKSE